MMKLDRPPFVTVFLILRLCTTIIMYCDSFVLLPTGSTVKQQNQILVTSPSSPVLSTFSSCCCCCLGKSTNRHWHLNSSRVTNSYEVTNIKEKAQKSNTNNDDCISKSTDPEYPYQFTGRLWFSPSLVKVPDKSNNAITKNQLVSNNVSVLSLFGYTLGGTVTLEYDTSPVGPYKEYVTMSSLVYKKGSIGQWGSRLYVSTQEAEDVCQQVWGVPAEVANIKFYEDDDIGDGDSDLKNQLIVSKPPCPNSQSYDLQKIHVKGWKNTRILKSNEYDVNGNAPRYGNIPVLWTPTIKALWSPWVAGGILSQTDGMKGLPLHKLRLSASAIRLSWSGLELRLDENVNNETKNAIGIPLGIGLIVDNVLIEIGSLYGKL